MLFDSSVPGPWRGARWYKVKERPIFLFSAADLSEAVYSSNVAINACPVSVIVSVVDGGCIM